MSDRKTLPEKILARVKLDFAPKYVERVFADMMDVATGNREGNAFEVAWLKRWIFPNK